MEASCFLLFLLMSLMAVGQTDAIKDVPRKGSYLYFRQPAFEDNSFLLEEAITQEKGILQHISTFHLDNLRGGNFVYSFSQELPITHLRHQLSYTLYYSILNPKTGSAVNGFGDIDISYSYMALGKKDWAMVVPSLTLIIPTGNASKGTGAGGPGGRLSIAVTKRLSNKLITNYNAGYTFILNADRYDLNGAGANVLRFEKDLQHVNVGASMIWYQGRKFNWMLEYVSNFRASIDEYGSINHNHYLTLNPGFRFAIDHPFMQIVPGLSAPILFINGQYQGTGLLFYLSFEPEYLPFNKPKGR